MARLGRWWPNRAIVHRGAAAPPVGITLVQQQVGEAAASTSQPVSFTSAAGNLLVAVVERSGGLGTGALSGVTDTAGNTWVNATRGAVSGISNTRIELWFAANAAAVTEITFAAAASQPWGWNISEWANADATPFDVASPDGSGGTAATSQTTPAITPSGADELVIGALAAPIAAAPTSQTSGYTDLANFDRAGAQAGRAAYQLNPSGSQQVTWTFTGSAAAGLVIVAFKPAGAAVPSGAA